MARHSNPVVYSINEDNPQSRLIAKVVEVLEEGGVIIYPTDTVYAYGCDVNNRHGIERLYSIKKISRKKPLSFVFSDVAQLHEYVRNISDHAFKVMKKVLPGPYTFIFKASKLVPKIAITNQKTIGVRIPENNVALEIVRALGRPIISTSVSTEEGEYVIEPLELEKRHLNEVDLIINCGGKISTPSTIVDVSEGDFVVVREGKGDISFME
ncbi:MAG TPA: L-threonylcarbamoyladenylate synthase [Spirochaetota bacterium]|nr:L-threonylcarbamoyladenylate synthase [Spirochaetota bacterium]HQO03818.1 L-threonylcarbamoyladenylate synthase [Spirochaetota bacterium]